MPSCIRAHAPMQDCMQSGHTVMKAVRPGTAHRKQSDIYFNRQLAELGSSTHTVHVTVLHNEHWAFQAARLTETTTDAGTCKDAHMT